MTNDELKTKWESAIQIGDVEDVCTLIGNGVKPTSSDLYLAAGNSYCEIVKILLDNGVIPEGDILSIPVKNGDMKIIKMLLDAGAEPSVNDVIKAAGKIKKLLISKSEDNVAMNNLFA